MCFIYGLFISFNYYYYLARDLIVTRGLIIQYIEIPLGFSYINIHYYYVNIII